MIDEMDPINIRDLLNFKKNNNTNKCVYRKIHRMPRTDSYTQRFHKSDWLIIKLANQNTGHRK